MIKLKLYRCFNQRIRYNGQWYYIMNDMENKLVNLMVEGVDIVERYSSMSNANNNNSNNNNNSGGGATIATTTGEWACPIVRLLMKLH